LKSRKETGSMDKMNNEILFFIIAFAFPLVYYRILLSTKSKVFEKPVLREKTGLKIHHIHYGMIISLIATIFFLFIGKNIYITTALGFGMGLIYDEFIPVLLMKSKRSDEIDVYKKSFKSTLIMFMIIIILLIILSLLI
jgi:hypothetical protein